MKPIDFKNPNEIESTLGKHCTVTFKVPRLQSETKSGIVTNIQFNDSDASLRIILETAITKIPIPVKFITSFEVQE